MMRMGRLIIVAVALAGAVPAFCQEGLPVHGSPKWFTVVGSGLTSGSVCLVRSAGTGAILGELPPGHRFMAFGTNSSWITLGFGGQVGYIPASAASELYPVSEANAEYRSGGRTLEDVAKEMDAKRQAAKNKPLAPSFNKPKDTPAGGMLPAMGGGKGGRGGSGEPGAGAV